MKYTQETNDKNECKKFLFQVKSSLNSIDVTQINPMSLFDILKIESEKSKSDEHTNDFNTSTSSAGSDESSSLKKVILDKDEEIKKEFISKKRVRRIDIERKEKKRYKCLKKKK